MGTSREMLGSRLGFLLLSAGCAIGLGNVWRFPYITGAYGGALFVAIYFIFLLAVLPIMVMEFSIGRASRTNLGRTFHILEPKGTHWHRFGWWSIVGSYALLMFYTSVSGWLVGYCWYMASGVLTGVDGAFFGKFFGETLASPQRQVGWMSASVLVGFGVCYMGVRGGVERVVKVMMAGLLLLVVALVIRSVTLEGAGAGIRFYLAPNVDKIAEVGLWNVCNAAMNQAFFTLSIGIGAMSIFGSYLEKERSLTGEAVWVAGLDTFVAIMAGLIIFPACSAFGVEANAGPGLVFITLPHIFNTMPLGQVWGALFFLFMSFAALSTVIAVFENIVSYCSDVWGMPRKRATVINALALWLLSLPCALGFNVLADITPLGAGSTILDFEDFIISNNMLPLGSLGILLFCCHKWGWGWDNFIAEVDLGTGMKFPLWLRGYLSYVLPCIIVVIFSLGYYEKFFK
ncbi:MAG: sodium-dependent transporter [Desulfovibrionaceae bacterium]|nr:sodium-dependent transporter [Desulfovibrionaceae bacterium]